MPRRKRDKNATDMTPLINFIRAHIKEQQRTNPRYTQAELARRSGLGQTTISELLNDPTHEILPGTLGKLAAGMGVEPLNLYRIAYPRGGPIDRTEGTRRSAVRLGRRTALLVANDPQLGVLLEILERLPPAHRSRVLAYAEGFAEAKKGQEGQTE